MVKCRIVLILLFAAISAHGQSIRFPALDTLIPYAGIAAPKGWHIKTVATGDLDGDARADKAVVFEWSREAEERRPDSSTNSGAPRVLAVYLYKPDTKQYRLLLQNNTFIPRRGEGGMDPEPFDGIAIRKNLLFINVEFVRGYIAYTFRLQHGDLFLIGADSGGSSGGMVSSFSANFLTGKAKVEEGLIESERLKVKWIRIPKELRRLRDMKMILQWEVAKNHYF
jgi:hypothetical protein